ncbi:MAG: DUF5946 family protein [Anaerolineae bacterium]
MSDPNARTVRCPGCGALVPDHDGATHPYIGASAGCWALFGEVMAREYGEYRYPAVHALTVDTYAAQHPGTPSRRSIQSVALHLMGLHLALERGYDAQRVIAERQRALRGGATYTLLEPPAEMGPLTILDVHAARDLAEHESVVRRWAASVWAAWAPHHAQIREWARVAPGA